MLGAVAPGSGAGSEVGGVVVEVLPPPDDPLPPQAVTVIATSRQASLFEDRVFIVVAALKVFASELIYALEPDLFLARIRLQRASRPKHPLALFLAERRRMRTVDFCGR